MNLLDQDIVLPLIIGARCGEIEGAERLFDETGEFLQAAVGNLHIASGYSAEGILKTILGRVSDNLHTYNPRSGPYASWVLDIMNGYAAYLSIKSDRENRHDLIEWKWELAYRESSDKTIRAVSDLNPFNSLHIRGVRRKFLSDTAGFCSPAEMRALLLSFGNPPDMEFWADHLKTDAEGFTALLTSAVRKLKLNIFDAGKSEELAFLVNLFTEKLSSSINITEEELEILGDETLCRAVHLALEKESAGDAARSVGMSRENYIGLLMEAYMKLHRELPGPEEESEDDEMPDIGSFELDESILRYRDKLLHYSIKHAITINRSFKSDQFRQYKSLLDFIYLLFTAQSMPPAMTELLTFAINKRASDLHLSAGLPPMLRVDGDIYRINIPSFDKPAVKKLVESIMNPDQREMYETDYELDFSHELPEGSRFRVNAFNQYRGPAAALRSIPARPMRLDEIGCAPVLKKITDCPSGLVLVTGPTGSGKSTTLSAMIDYKNNKDYLNIVTIEDPVEYLHKSKKCLINQREVFRNTHSFNRALRSALREDPDIILIGEMRDLETIRLALTAAETGHLVFATLHTNSAAQTIDRIIDVFPTDEKTMVRCMVSESLQAVITQSMVKKIGGGRVAALEIMVANPAIRNLIREGNTAQMYSTIQLSSGSGMQTLEQSLQILVEKKIISPEQAYAKAVNKKALRLPGFDG